MLCLVLQVYVSLSLLESGLGLVSKLGLHFLCNLVALLDLCLSNPNVPPMLANPIPYHGIPYSA
jgi:hypothetical protein